MKIRTSAIVTALAALSLFVPLLASAHERDTFIIGGKSYQLIVGSIGEPLLVDDKSGVDFTALQGGRPVTGLEKDLKVELQAGSAKRVLSFDPTDTPGAYVATFIPTVATTYAYRIFGTINAVPVDLTFTCAVDGTYDENALDAAPVAISDKIRRTQKIGAFGCPEARSDYGFPEVASTVAEQKTSLNNVKSEALAKAAQAQNLGILGIAIGALALIAARRKKT